MSKVIQEKRIFVSFTYDLPVALDNGDLPVSNSFSFGQLNSISLILALRFSDVFVEENNLPQCRSMHESGTTIGTTMVGEDCEVVLYPKFSE